MQLKITHETRYAYAPAVETAQHMTHLRPRQGPAQQLVEHQLNVTPRPDQMSEVRDVYGNARTFFSLQTTHRELVVSAISRVATREPDWPATSAAWELVRERYRYRANGPWDASAEFVFASPQVPRHDEFAEYARPSFRCGAPLLSAVADLTRRLHADMSYDPDSTEIGTPALQALRQRKGVCQDFAHIELACLRMMGIAARYVSGYLLTMPAPGRPRLIGCDASHAWVSVYVPGRDEDGSGGGWCDFDPTNDRMAGADYVTLAVGRDYFDVAPIRGVIHGGARHTLSVAVTVEPLADAAPRAAGSGA